MGNETSRLIESEVARLPERLPSETFEQYQSRCEDIEKLFEGCQPFNPSDVLYQRLARYMGGISWDSIPKPEWHHEQCFIWIRAYMIHQLDIDSGLATNRALGFFEDGYGLLSMEKKDWVKLYPEGGLSIWGRLNYLRAKGLLDDEVEWVRIAKDNRRDVSDEKGDSLI